MTRHRPPRSLTVVTTVYLALWLAAVVTWKYLERSAGTGGLAAVLPALWWTVFGLSMPLGVLWLRWSRARGAIVRRAVATAVFLPWWQLAVFAADALAWEALRSRLALWGTVLLFVLGLAWVVWALERLARLRTSEARDDLPDLSGETVTLILLLLIFPPALLVWGCRQARPVRRVALAAVGLWLWFALAMLIPYWRLIDGWVGESSHAAAAALTAIALVVGPLLSAPFLQAQAEPIGTQWWVILSLMVSGWIALVATLSLGVVWRYRRVGAHVRRRIASDHELEHEGLAEVEPPPASVPPLLAIGAWWPLAPLEPEYVWNPLDPEAWYYGRRSQKLNQTMAALVSYSFTFMVAYLVLTHVGGCQEVYEMPAGGGQQQPLAQQVKVQKVIRKKYVVNPLSVLKFKVPPIDDVQVINEDMTKHAYTVGYGQGEGAGYAGGTKAGKVRFIRLEYSGGDWDQDFGVGADLNMLLEYGNMTGQKVAERTESRRVAELANFKIEKSPPMVFLTGQKNISLSKSEIKILREYLLDKHGMLFIDNGGSRHFHNQAVQMMHQVLPNVREVPIPRDDILHRVPFSVPGFPYVSPHGGIYHALGWKVDGRWVAYYHPGDIADAWADDRAGVSKPLQLECYKLGANIINYAHAEYSKWLTARQKNE